MATKHSSEAITAFLKEWTRLRQEMTQVRFCEERGLSQRTFRSWLQRLEVSEPRSASPRPDEAETAAEMIAKAEALVDELNRMIDTLRPASRAESSDWHRWILDAACRTAIRP